MDSQENSTCMLLYVGMNDSGIFRKIFSSEGGQGADDHSHRWDSKIAERIHQDIDTSSIYRESQGNVHIVITRVKP